MGPLEEGLARVTDAELAFALSVFLPTRARHELVAGSVPSVQALIDTLKVFPATAFLGFVSESNRSGTFTLKAKTADPFGATSRSEFGFDESARKKTSKRTFSLLSSRKSTEISSTPPANDAATLFDWVSCHSDPFHAASAVPRAGSTWIRNSNPFEPVSFQSASMTRKTRSGAASADRFAMPMRHVSFPASSFAIESVVRSAARPLSPAGSGGASPE